MTPIPSPNLNLEALGRVALAGDFDAISLYAYAGQTQGINSNGSQSILSSLPNGAYAALSSADANIHTMCDFIMRDGTSAGVIVGGNFTSLGGIDSQGIALFDPVSTNITALPGVLGTVSSILCDQETNSVYVGGSFRAANSTNAIAWVGMTGWANLPFAGFNGPVTSITKAPDGHIVFGGSFSGLGRTTMPTQRDEQVINLASATITTGFTTRRAGFDDPTDIVCPSNGTDSATRTWLLADDSPGFWQANMRFGYEPTKLRIWNTNQDGRGTRTFRFTALPINGIMNFTYTDPATGENAACDARCPLSHNATNPYQDFYFVNLVGMNGFRIDISDWYGSGGGLNGIELFQDDIFAYAVNGFNEPSCSNAEFPSEATAVGPWTVTPSGQSVSEYLTASIGANSASASVIFRPDIKQSGNYSVTIYTPGCMQDATCPMRGIVNVTASLTSSGGPAFSTQIFQTNSFDKYDQVFLGEVEASTDSFRPSVTISPGTIRNGQRVVASRIRFGLISFRGGLNGLFEFNPNQAVVDQDLAKSAINTAGNQLQPFAVVNALITHDDTIISAGRFANDNFENIMAFRGNNATSLPDGGLNAGVETLFDSDDLLYVGGNFTRTSTGGVTGLNNIAAYRYSSNEWVAIGAGLDGPVESIVPLQLNITQNEPETTITFSGQFTSILATGNSEAINARGFAVWVPSRNDWLLNLDVPQMMLAGQLGAYANVSNGTSLIAGTLVSQGQAISGAASLRGSSRSLSIGQLPINIRANPAASSLTKRELTGNQNVSGVVTGQYFDNDGRNITILGGRFVATATDGSQIENLLFLNGGDNDVVTGLPFGIDNNSTFLALETQDNLLFAGGSITGQVSGSSVDGVVLYDLSSANYFTTQPPALVGENVIVNAIATRPGSSEVYVGGSFEMAGSLGCASVCMYQTSTGQWNTPGNGLSGTASALYWASDRRLMAAGNLTVSGNTTGIASYDARDQIWTTMSTTAIPGPVTAFANGRSDASRMWAAGTANNGSAFLVEIDGDNFRPVGDVFGSNTNIRGLQVLPLSESHGPSSVLDDDEALLVSGQLDLPGFGSVSAALYNGTTLTPFVLSSTSDGQAGSISRMVTQNTYVSTSNRKCS